MEGVSRCPVNEKHRFRFWQWALGRELDYGIFEPLHGGDWVGYYLHHRQLLTPSASTKSSGQLGEIMRDVGRTCPEHPFFDSKKKQPGEILIARILCATVSSTPNIGYCQGMNFVVATLLLARLAEETNDNTWIQSQDEKENGEDNINTGDDNNSKKDENENTKDLSKDVTVAFSEIDEYDEIEAEVFWMFQSILIKNDRGLEMEFIWKPTFPKMKLRVFQFDRLLELYMPDLHSYFEEICLSPEVVVSQWFMTLFSNTLPLPLTLHMWDYIFLGGWPGIFRAALAILCVFRDKLLEMDLEEVGLLLREWKRRNFDITVSFSDLLCTAETFDITLDSLIMLQENYALEMIAAALGDDLDANSALGKTYHGGCMGLPKPGGNSWLRRYGDFPENMKDEMMQIHNEINDMSIQVDRDKAVLQNKILKACEMCERTYDELERALREEMKWLQNTSNLKHDLSSWERKAKSALAELRQTEESDKKTASLKLAYEEEDDDSDEYESDGDSTGSSYTSSGEYVDDEVTDESDEYDDDESYGYSEETSDSSAPKQTGGGGFFDAVTNLLVPGSAPPVQNEVIVQNTNFHDNGMVMVESTLPQHDDGRNVEQRSIEPSATPSSTPSSTPEMNKLPISGSSDSIAEKIKSNPNRRRSTSIPGVKQQSSSNDSSPVTSSTKNEGERSDIDDNKLHDDVPVHTRTSGEASCESHSTANDTIDIVTSSPQISTNVSSSSSSQPQSPSRFQNFKNNVLRRSSSQGSSSPGGGGRIGFSRRYIASKLEHRKAKIMKAKECHYLHKQIIKSTKCVLIYNLTIFFK